MYIKHSTAQHSTIYPRNVRAQRPCTALAPKTIGAACIICDMPERLVRGSSPTSTIGIQHGKCCHMGKNLIVQWLPLHTSSIRRQVLPLVLYDLRCACFICTLAAYHDYRVSSYHAAGTTDRYWRQCTISTCLFLPSFLFTSPFNLCSLKARLQDRLPVLFYEWMHYILFSLRVFHNFRGCYIVALLIGNSINSLMIIIDPPFFQTRSMSWYSLVTQFWASVIGSGN